ncbi:Conidiation protein 6 [Rhizoctonia solani]|uniref:Conidiation protein 6 n=1 Tax=Rhizoctonia solani TaxID=456999 RepID=A0A8H7LJ69_9AGAM|nr:Conidiation protein 6 [Rhizoctonia solani]
MFGSRRTRATHTTHTSTRRGGFSGMFHRKNPNRRAGGYKAALHNPNTTSAGRQHAKRGLRSMDRGNEAHVPLSVRIKHFLHIGGRRRHTTTHRY